MWVGSPFEENEELEESERLEQDEDDEADFAWSDSALSFYI